MTSVPAVLYAAAVTLAAIVSATVAAWHGTIDGQTYASIVTGALGLGAGAGIHAAGTQTAAQTATRTAAQIAEVTSPTLAASASTADLQAELDRRKGTV